MPYEMPSVASGTVAATMSVNIFINGSYAGVYPQLAILQGTEVGVASQAVTLS